MNHEEEDLQIQTATWLLWQRRDLTAWHTPNGGKRGKLEAVRLKRMGVLPGVPDWTIFLPRGGVMFIELKSRDGKQTPEQRRFQEIAEVHGCPYRVVRSLEEFKAVVDELAIRSGT